MKLCEKGASLVWGVSPCNVVFILIFNKDVRKVDVHNLTFYAHTEFPLRKVKHICEKAHH